MRDVGALAVFVAMVAIAAFFGARFQPGSWYEGLQKPPLNPPSWVFGPVWSVLYLASAVAGWLVWRARPAARRPLALWGGQLVLNAAWSPLFFGLHLPGLALVDILLLLGLVIATTASFHRVRMMAGALFVPYAAWVGFAAYLNAGLWYLNR
jgi:tryptophan-rich sensory protein